MKTSPFRYHLLLMFVPLIFINVAFADQIWVGSSTSDVFNEDLFIDGSAGDVILPTGPRFIQATSADVTVTLADNPVVRGNASGESQLHLTALGGRKITFVLDSNDLTFKGSANVAQNVLLMINNGVFSGGGKVEFVMDGGRTLTFTSDVGSSGGVWFYNETIPNGFDTLDYLVFTRNQTSDSAPNDNINVVVGAQSILGFMKNTIDSSPSVTNTVFYPSNTIGSTGRMTLSIQPTGAVLNYPVTLFWSPPTNSTQIARNIIAPDAVAIFKVEGTAPPQGFYNNLQVVNSNSELFELLIDPFCTLGTQTDPDFIGSYNGIQYGFVVGANGIVDIDDNAVLDYVGTHTNLCPVSMSTFCDGAGGICSSTGCEMSCTGTLIKARNPSAFFVDGSYNPFLLSAQIQFGVDSALVFRSGVDKYGVVENPNEPFQFDIDPANATGCAGEIVFDVEGLLRVKGSNIGDELHSKIELLSRDVYYTGGPLFYNTDQVIFPIRSFTFDDAGLPRQYNKGAFLINNRMVLCGTTLVHTDLNHIVVSKNDVVSEPAYIGGERPLLCGGERPKIMFNDSRLLMHESAAFTGVDLFVPNRVATSPQIEQIVGMPNLSKFIFFNNGYVLDNGTGRQMVLGTLPGSTACDGCTIVSNDAHLDVMQDVDFGTGLIGDSCVAAAQPACTVEDIVIGLGGCSFVNGDEVEQRLELEVAANTTVINDQISGDIDNQFAIQTIYLGNSSNISIGTNEDVSPFNQATLPELLIDGNFYSFETRGGPLGVPASSQVTGKGGIFVDLNGTFAISKDYRANMAAMVTRSRNGIVDLPKNQVLFHNRVGVANWKLDLINDDSVIIGPDEYFSDYSMNWIDTVKNFELFTPYVVDSVTSCTCPPVTSENISPVPTVLGRVDQMQILGSRLGDEAYLKVGNGGFIRELIYLVGCVSGEEPVGVVILENDSRVGLGSAHRNNDSLSGSIRLGVNGVSIIGNGTADVVLNEDIEIDNVCPILRGPDFTSTSTLRITSEDPRVFTVKKTGVLDLRSFGANETVEFGGQITIILEPGARIQANGGTIRLADQARMVVQSVERAEEIFLTNTSSDVTITDDFRVKMIGTGVLELAECSAVFVESDSFLGVETLFEVNGTDTCQIDVTDFTLRLLDSSEFILGTDCEDVGGTLQIGNTVEIPGHIVRFTIRLESPDATFHVKSNGFLGFGVGIASKGTNIPNEWRIDNLFNVDTVAVRLIDGLFAHDRIYDGASKNASLFAIGQDTIGSPQYIFSYEPKTTSQSIRTNNAGVHGGGNLVLLVQDFTGPMNPIVGSVDNQVVNGRMVVGTMAAMPLLPNFSQGFFAPATTFFNAIKTYNMRSNLDNRARSKSNISDAVKEFGKVQQPARALFIYGPTNTNAGTIERMDVYDIQPNVLGLLPGVVIEEAIEVGGANVAVTNPAQPQESAFFSLIPQ